MVTPSKTRIKKKPARKPAKKALAPRRATQERLKPTAVKPKSKTPPRGAGAFPVKMEILSGEGNAVSPQELLERLSTPVGQKKPVLSARDLEAEQDERRRHLRVPYGAWVNVVRDGRQEFCMAQDISEGGIFLRTTQPPNLGEDIELLLIIENEATPLPLRGQVVRRTQRDGGFGVRFGGLDPAAQQRLFAVVADARWAQQGG